VEILANETNMEYCMTVHRAWMKLTYIR